jgi:hypothetical protein
VKVVAGRPPLRSDSDGLASITVDDDAENLVLTVD